MTEIEDYMSLQRPLYDKSTINEKEMIEMLEMLYGVLFLVVFFIMCVLAYRFSVYANLLACVVIALEVSTNSSLEVFKNSGVANYVFWFLIIGIVMVILNGFELIHYSVDRFFTTVIAGAIAYQFQGKLITMNSRFLVWFIAIAMIVLPRIFFEAKKSHEVVVDEEIVGNTIYRYTEPRDMTKNLINFGYVWMPFQKIAASLIDGLSLYVIFEMVLQPLGCFGTKIKDSKDIMVYIIAYAICFVLSLILQLILSGSQEQVSYEG